MIVRVFVAARLHCSALVRSSDEIEALMRSTAGAFQAAHSAKARAAASSGQEGRARPRSPGPDLAAWTSVGLAAGVEAPKEPGPEDCCVRLVFLIPQFSSMSIDVFTPRRSNVGARTVFGMSIWRPRSSMRGAFFIPALQLMCYTNDRCGHRSPKYGSYRRFQSSAPPNKSTKEGSSTDEPT